MARKPAQTQPEEFIVTEEQAPLNNATPAVAATNMLAALAADYNQERDLVNQLLGQAQMAEAFGKFSQTVWSSKLAFVKENKLYRALAGKKSPNGLELQGTWEEFCGLLGVSDEKANQDIANLRAFGEEALESMSRMGIGYRELRQFRRLPEDQKTALIEVAKAGDKDSFLELAEDLIAKHQKEKESLEKTVKEAKADMAAVETRMAEKETLINRYAKENALLKSGKQDDLARQRADLEAHLLRNLQDKALTLLGTINEVAVAVADIEANEPTEAMTTAIEQTVTWLFQSIAKIAHERYLPVDFEAVVKGEFFDTMGFGAVGAEAEGAEA